FRRGRKALRAGGGRRPGLSAGGIQPRESLRRTGPREGRGGPLPPCAGTESRLCRCPLQPGAACGTLRRIVEGRFPLEDLPEARPIGPMGRNRAPPVGPPAPIHSDPVALNTVAQALCLQGRDSELLISPRDYGLPRKMT